MDNGWIEEYGQKIEENYGAFHPDSDTDKLYLTREKKGHGLIVCESFVWSDENNLRWYVKNSVDPLIWGVRLSEVTGTKDAISRDELRRTWTSKKEQRWKEKRMYSQFVWVMSEPRDAKKTWAWLGKANLKIQAESYLCAAQGKPLGTNYVKHRIDKSVGPPLCRMCEGKGETVHPIVSECKKMAQREYKQRHENIARLVH